MPKSKGPTWSEIHDPKKGNRIEMRDSGGYVSKHSTMGRTSVDMNCPFCAFRLTAYIWSLAGGGKRCDCGAMCGSSGQFFHWADKKHRADG